MPLAIVTNEDFQPAESFDHLVRQFRDKVPLRSSQFEQLTARERATAFRIAGVEHASIIARIRRRIAKSLLDGDFRSVLKAMRGSIAKGDFRRSTTNRLSIVYRTNVAHAWSVAEERMSREPAVRRVFEFAMYTSSRDRFVRETHKKLDGLVFRLDDPFWDHYKPPWEWGCRCDRILLRGADVERRKLKVQNMDFVRSKLRIEPHPDFDFPRDQVHPSERAMSLLDPDLAREVQRIDRQRTP